MTFPRLQGTFSWVTFPFMIEKASTTVTGVTEESMDTPTATYTEDFSNRLLGFL